MVCVVGIAPVKPAQFVVFRIGQKTADANNWRG
jgi:phage tail sheath protein FI